MAERYDARPRLIQDRPRAARVGLIIIIAIIVVVILILLIVLVVNKKSTTSTSTTGTIAQCVTDADCSGTQVCETKSGLCVECLSNSQCSVYTPICDTTNHKCVVCEANTDCPSYLPLCTNNICVACTSDSQCGGATPKCNNATRTCVGCNVASDCPSATPLCSAANECVQCISNTGCIAPATCVHGTCCNTATPSISTLAASSCSLNLFTGTYTFAQTGPNLSAIYRIADSGGNVLVTLPGVTANGVININYSQVSQLIIFYVGYNYSLSVAISQPCGITAFSAPISVTIPQSSPAPVKAVIASASATVSTITVILSTPDFQTDFLWSVNGVDIHITPTLGPSPNLWTVQSATFVQVDPSNSHRFKITAAWPFAVTSGQSYFLSVSGNFSPCDKAILSTPVQLTVP